MHFPGGKHFKKKFTSTRGKYFIIQNCSFCNRVHILENCLFLLAKKKPVFCAFLQKINQNKAKDGMH